MKRFFSTILSIMVLTTSAMAQGMEQVNMQQHDNIMAGDTKTGGKYIGKKKNGKMHGKGIYEWENGDTYEGDFADGQMEGYGRYTWVEGDIYQGDFKGESKKAMEKHSILTSAISTRVNGRTENATEMAKSLGQTVTPTKEIGLMTCARVKECSRQPMGTSMQDIT